MELQNRYRRNRINKYSSMVLRGKFRQRFELNGSQIGADDAFNLLTTSSDKFQTLIAGFYIYGCYPWEKCNEGKNLFSFPENDMSSSLFIPFCFPDGLNKSSSAIDKNGKRVIQKCELIQTTFDEKQIDDAQFFTLYFPENEQAPYLFVLRYKVNPLTMPTICHNFSLLSLLEKINLYDMPSCYQCIAIKSKLPYDSLFEELMKWILQCEMIGRMQISDELDNFLNGNIVKEHSYWPKDCQKQMFDNLQFLFSLTTNCIDEKIFIDELPFPTFQWKAPDVAVQYYPLAARSTYNFVKHVDIHMFWSIFSAMLLERQIIVYHPDIEIASSVILSLHFLLKPLKWVLHSFSVLPPTMIDFSNSPSSVLIGTIIEIANTDQDCVTVNLKERKVIAGRPINIHPKEKKFCNRFQHSYQEINSPESPVIIEMIESCNHIVEKMISKINASIMSDYSDESNIQSKFIEELYLQHFKEEEREFLHCFCDAQMFMMYTEQLCRKKSENMRFDS